ncbi:MULTISPECIES: TIGR02450 family Trp-rich protein [Nitrincola]|uniref:Tryptophan-rich protein (DUF2389) n=1 Tax=Nitrincola nitratireducens TaxID=1229521 RepID=W9UXW8_9GAMM|nr:MULTISPECIES: TIGR02450 family Trp-rich protein [Nitrincola]EXJ11904.1 hypothetical protein D791_01277 [Nitrincola nitratireducens]
MNKLNPEKLLNSKWTAVSPQNKEKHFIVIELVRDENERVHACVLEAVMTKNTYPMPWQSLKNHDIWQLGWK